MKLTRYEQETVITYNEEEKDAQIFTCHQRLIKKLKGLIGKRNDFKLVREDDYGCTFIVPKKWIKANPSRILSEEQKKILSERAKSHFKLNK